MRALAWLALALTAGCLQTGPGPVAFEAALGEPGCALRHPDGSDAPCGAEQALAVEAAPPPDWTCVNEGTGAGFRYAVYRSLATGESGVAFEDRNFGAAPTWLLLDSTQPGFVGQWNGTDHGFVRLGTAVGRYDEVAVFVYTFQVTAAEGEAVRATARERWSNHEQFPWLAYEVTYEGETYWLSGMSSAKHPMDLDVSNAAGRLATRLDWNGGWHVGGGDAPGCATA